MYYKVELVDSLKFVLKVPFFLCFRVKHEFNRYKCFLSQT